MPPVIRAVKSHIIIGNELIRMPYSVHKIQLSKYKYNIPQDRFWTCLVWMDLIN